MGIGARGSGGGGDEGRTCLLLSTERDRAGLERKSVIDRCGRIDVGGGVGAGRNGMNSVALLAGRGKSSRVGRLLSDRERGAGLEGSPTRALGRLGRAICSQN